MGKMKKAGINSKAVAAKERKANAAAEKNAAKSKAAEDAKWADNDKKNAKKQNRKAAAQEKAAADQARKAEARAALAAENAANASVKQKGKAAKTGPTQAQIAAKLQREKATRERNERETDAQETTPVTEQPLHENRNREIAQLRADGHVEATGIDEAVAELEIDAPTDKHPEKRRKALHRKFEERMMPILKAENPGLRHSQLKDMCFKMWQTSPENPSNMPK